MRENHPKIINILRGPNLCECKVIGTIFNTNYGEFYELHEFYLS
jgi:hypothetical protein